MTILVTGGAGFIGSALVPALVAGGHTVVVADNFSGCYAPALKRRHAEAHRYPSQTLHRGDIRDQAFLHQLLHTHAIDVVVHLAGLAGVRASLQNPAAYFDHNLNGTATLLDAMRTAGVNRLVFASSSSVYGNRQAGAFRETDCADKPVSPYAHSKRAAELLCQQHHHLYGLHAYCLRLFTVYGPRQRPDMAITQFIRQLQNDQPITLFGDGHSQRDYTYLTDVVGGIVRATERVNGYELINLGSANPISLVGLIQLLEQVTNRQSRIEWLGAQPGDVPHTHADISKARRLLGYHPATDLIDGLGEMVNQHQYATVTS